MHLLTISTRRQSESYPKLNPGAIIVADNMLRGAAEGVKRCGRAVRAKPGITSVLLPVGSGIEVSHFEPT
jgi:predicted O-methyltransferase YrrM